MKRVLIIEDQAKLRRNLRQVLEEEGYQVVDAVNGEAGLTETANGWFDAIVLDLSLPGRNGLEILAELRASGFARPIMILTARDGIDDRVAGLDAGADDYLVKPFAHAELLARLRALLRRGGEQAATTLTCQDVDIDLLARRVVRAGNLVELSQREFDLLEYLVRHRNCNVTREMLARDVWKDPLGLLTNVIDVCINSLRKKLDLPGTEPLIHTVRGVGYVVKDDPCED